MTIVELVDGPGCKQPNAGAWTFIDEENMWCKSGHQGCVRDRCLDESPWQVWCPLTGVLNCDRATRGFVERTRLEGSHLRLAGDLEPKVVLRPGRKESHEWWCERVQDTDQAIGGVFCFHQDAVIVAYDWNDHDEDKDYHDEDNEINPRGNPLTWEAYRAARVREFIGKYQYARGVFYNDPLHGKEGQ